MPSIETGPKDLTDSVCDRVIEILKYKNENPDKEWSEIPELVYMNVQSEDGSENTISIKKFSISSYENHIDKSKSGLNIELYYVPSKISLKELSEVEPLHCEITNFIISEAHKTKVIRELYVGISCTYFVIEKPTEEEVQEFLQRLYRRL